MSMSLSHLPHCEAKSCTVLVVMHLDTELATTTVMYVGDLDVGRCILSSKLVWLGIVL